MLFITPSFFEFEPVKIANVADAGDVKADLCRFIGIYEKQCLIDVLGDCLYKELRESFEYNEDQKKFVLKGDASEPIKRLVNGHEYEAPDDDTSYSNFLSIYWNIFGFGCGCGCGENTCNQRRWKGIVQSDEYLDKAGALKENKKSFISDYIYYHYKLINRTTTSGSGENKMGSENGETVSNFSKRIDRWNEFVFQVVGRKNETSLFRFLQDNKEDYPTWSPNCNVLRFKDKF